MDELATDPVEAVAVGGEVAAKCGLVLWMLSAETQLMFVMGETALLPEWAVALALQETAQLGPIGVLKAPNALFLHAGAIRLLPIFQELLELFGRWSSDAEAHVRWKAASIWWWRRSKGAICALLSLHDINSSMANVHFGDMVDQRLVIREILPVLNNSVQLLLLLLSIHCVPAVQSPIPKCELG